MNTEDQASISQTFTSAYIGVPSGVTGLTQPFYGLFKDFIAQHPEFNTPKDVSTVLFLHGSSGFSSGEFYRQLITEEAQCIFIAPDSFQVKNRPTYKSPALQSEYKKVQNLRLKELQYALTKIEETGFINMDRIFLMGHSEGGLAAAQFRSTAFKGRIVTAFSCEPCYFCTDFKLGSSESEPFLNIIGSEDQFFARNSETNKDYQVEGHGLTTLRKNKNAKIVILGNTKHDLTSNKYLAEELTSFINQWS